MIGSPVGRSGLKYDARRDQGRAVRLLFKGGFASVLNFVVVIKQVYFVGVNVPGADAGYFSRQAGAGEGVVEVAEFAAEEVGVCLRAEKCGLEVGEPASRQCG